MYLGGGKMKLEHTIDINTFTLYSLLQTMVYLDFSSNIKSKLNQFILYLEDIIYANVELSSDIIEDKFIHIMTCKGSNN